MLEFTSPKDWSKIIWYFLTISLIAVLWIALETGVYWLAKFMVDNQLGVIF